MLASAPNAEATAAMNRGAGPPRTAGGSGNGGRAATAAAVAGGGGVGMGREKRSCGPHNGLIAKQSS